jgi:hypothetical protein
MPRKKTVDPGKFNQAAVLPYELRLKDFELAMQDVYDFFHDVNGLLQNKGLRRLDDMLRPAAMSGMISDMLTASMAKHARSLVENAYFNGHPDLILHGIYPNSAVASGDQGIEIKSTRKGAARSIPTAQGTSGCACSCTRPTTRPNQSIRAARCASWRSTSLRSRKAIFDEIRAATWVPARQRSTAEASGSSDQTGSIF